MADDEWVEAIARYRYEECARPTAWDTIWESRRVYYNLAAKTLDHLRELGVVFPDRPRRPPDPKRDAVREVVAEAVASMTGIINSPTNDGYVEKIVDRIFDALEQVEEPG